MQHKDRYAGKEENTEVKGSIKEIRRLKTGNFRNHEK